MNPSGMTQPIAARRRPKSTRRRAHGGRWMLVVLVILMAALAWAVIFLAGAAIHAWLA